MWGAGGALVVLILLVAFLTLGRTKPPAVDEKTTPTPAAEVKPSPITPPPVTEPVVTPASPAAAQPDSSGVVRPAGDDTESERLAKAKEAAKKRADALKALDEPQ